MTFGFLIILAVVVVAVALPLILKQIGGNKPSAAANLPYRKKDYLFGESGQPSAVCSQPDRKTEC